MKAQWSICWLDHKIAKLHFVKNYHCRWKAVLRIWCKKQIVKYALQNIHISKTQEISNDKDTNEDNSYYFLPHHRYYSCAIHPKMPVNLAYHLKILPSLFEAVQRKMHEIQLNNWFVHHANTPLQWVFCPSFVWQKDLLLYLNSTLSVTQLDSKRREWCSHPRQHILLHSFWIELCIKTLMCIHPF
jgi:hypothetical protein